MADLTDIQHVVVLMLENRSFDNLLGFLRPASDSFDGLLGRTDLAVPVDGGDHVRPWTAQIDTALKTLPSPDPGESFDDITQQLYNGEPTHGVAPMNGFAMNYASRGGQPHDIMHCYTPDDVPVLSQLANTFGVCDRWFASAPCQTWPNRFFMHCGTAHGYENNTLDAFPFPMQTIFNELDGVAPWKIYFHDFPQTALLSKLWTHFDRFHKFEAFLADAKAGQLPGYAFIEPMYFPHEHMPNDMHPPHDVRFADRLVASVYNAVRQSPNWPKTMLIVMFDEHGGCYDHVPPPAATPPEPMRPGQTFGFDRFGVRVPAVVISPYTSNAVLRAPGPQPFDHTSISRTLRSCFGLKTPLSAREAAAPDLSIALNAAFDANRGPASIELPQQEIDDTTLTNARGGPLTGLQTLLQTAASNLAPLSEGEAIDQHLQALVRTQIAMANGIQNALNGVNGENENSAANGAVDVNHANGTIAVTVANGTSASHSSIAAEAGAVGAFVREVIDGILARFKGDAHSARAASRC
ncbi:alkaline phosphatase family protein [Paraburkholderia phosphatilytica]|uniref:alkaline phosphatase family protein n=1 Tax=Paraburkholderia phosphatilytica TaxID=2282883 RepID=UPI000E53428D|nr:alkaline phosphatase family protein [Paraburkholderia phosphatilytica]